MHRDDASTHLWMTQNVLNAAEYASRIRAIAESALTEERDVVALRNGRILERVSKPQLARGRPTGRVFSFRDITQQLANESRLQLAAEVFDSSLDAICVADPHGLIAAANPSFERLSGCTVSQLQETKLWEMIHSPHHAAFEQDVAQGTRELRTPGKARPTVTARAATICRYRFPWFASSDKTIRPCTTSPFSRISPRKWRPPSVSKNWPTATR